MNDLRNKLVQRISNSKFLKDLREFECLIKAIGECKSKLEEDRIITKELEVLKQVCVQLWELLASHEGGC